MAAGSFNSRISPMEYVEDSDIPGPQPHSSEERNMAHPSVSSFIPKDFIGTDLLTDKDQGRSLDLNTIIEVVQYCKLNNDFTKLLHVIECAFSSPEALRLAFAMDPPHHFEQVRGNNVEVTVNLTDVRNAYKVMLSASKEASKTVEEQVLRTFASAFRQLSSTRSCFFQINFVNILNYFNPILIAMELVLLVGLHCEPLANTLSNLSSLMSRLCIKGQAVFAKLLAATYDAAHLGKLLEHLHQDITKNVKIRGSPYATICEELDVMRMVYYASLYGGVLESEETLKAERLAKEALIRMWQNISPQNSTGLQCQRFFRGDVVDPLARRLGVNALDCISPMLAPEKFINEGFSRLIYEHLPVISDDDSDQNLSINLLHSFALSADTKNKIMQEDNRNLVNISSANMAGGQFYLYLQVLRNYLVEDTNDMLELVYLLKPTEVHKQLRVKFEGEPGLDEGGVAKEFFQLYVRELLNPNMGMFCMDDGSDYFWINPVSPAGDKEFTAAGLILGMAIYNGIILDVRLPPVLYRKLAGKLGCLKDLKSIHPCLYCSLQSLLTYEGGTTELMTYFSVSQKNSAGEIENFDLINGGSEVLVTDDNKQRFVELYADFLLNKQIERQFAAFAYGFHLVMDRTLLQDLFSPEEMAMVIDGEQNLDFQALQSSAKYDSGYTEDSPIIKQFWEIAQEMDEEQKRQLLKFTTGSDRVPMGGLSELGFKITKNGPDTDWLPTAHTCFNTLLLPQYSSKEKLKDRLVKAIAHHEGFGLL